MVGRPAKSRGIIHEQRIRGAAVQIKGRRPPEPVWYQSAGTTERNPVSLIQDTITLSHKTVEDEMEAAPRS